MSDMGGVYFDNFNMRHCFMFTVKDYKNNDAAKSNSLFIKQNACFTKYRNISANTS